ncbi:hypothetical protein A2348_03230 [Candidatus Uhrbacteria bacterium RIFOXYB12_FULL_58_10]|uniref:Uncharacterized protein n=1 Tax=Candidatus Uhrbacteria bacterium RIFOXYB2_FULL_57_15 TaxID=1802422 RepID=A0A1F7WA40_9BACT|nr:MAG: hypothetical protein A2348_03230 [Candidatus Uhrbacteria bacterium RIFOXYB12_FULL_58_10]OGL99456.1 MAG: hypothetical protein A2304_02445 [Candidatus Uhrbacteria bacterium RIFOXYB2_FULL_57_15]OGL99896.1 MAG: hypothetical protein A2501_05195 [Candidatus Uhrbacteria bacterium RIFOXYC12_FULL_57_11]
MAERRRHGSTASLIAAADIMTCFIGILLVVLVRSKVTVEHEVEALEARKVELQSEVAVLAVENDETFRRMESEHKKKEARIKAEIAEQEVQLAQKQQSFKDWDWVVNRFRESRGMSRDPDAHLYLRSQGIYRDGNAKPLSDAQVIAFLTGQFESASTRPDGKSLVAAWQENGANDQYIRMLDMRSQIPGLDRELSIYTIVLPTGAHAGAEQKGNEPIERKQGGGR